MLQRSKQTINDVQAVPDLASSEQGFANTSDEPPIQNVMAFAGVILVFFVLFFFYIF